MSDLALHGRPVRQLRVFLAEDDPQLRRLMSDLLRRDRHLVIEASDGQALLDHLEYAFWRDGVDPEDSVIITDVRMPRRGGIDVVVGARRMAVCPPIIIVTGFADEKLHAEARRLGALAVFDKPFDVDRLRARVNQIAAAAQYR
jgi:DNA-binding response OmpR family regulator